jgi:hypothetical protein
METHVNYILSFVNQWLYLISQLRKTGSSAKAREVVFHSLIISRLLYALPSFAGFCLVLILLTLIPYFANWLDCLFDFDELEAAAENRLFKRFSFNLNDCFHQLLP